jgi:ubiquitin-like protein Pup
MLPGSASKLDGADLLEYRDLRLRGGSTIPSGRYAMEKQERKQEVRREPQGKEEVKANPKVVETGKKLKEDIDKLVDEIDDVLEKNAEEFVKNYVQKGGE